MKRSISILVICTALTWASGEARAEQERPGTGKVRTYSTQELAALFERPKDISGLVRNLAIAWDKKLLVQQAFYDESKLVA